MGNWGSGSQTNIPRKSLASEDRSYLDACMKEQQTPNLPYETLQKSNGAGGRLNGAGGRLRLTHAGQGKSLLKSVPLPDAFLLHRMDVTYQFYLFIFSPKNISFFFL